MILFHFLHRSSSAAALLLLILSRADTWAAIPAVSVGGKHSLFLKSDGTVLAAGNNYWGQLADGTFQSRSAPVPIFVGAEAIAAGPEHSLFLKEDGTVWVAGFNSYGQLGIGNNAFNPGIPKKVPGIDGVKAIATGSYQSLFLKADGTVWFAGNDPYRPREGGPPPDGIPTEVSGVSGVMAISSGDAHSLFLRQDGTVLAAGANGMGQLGDGTLIYRTVPVPVLTGVQAISAGGYHSLFLKTDGSVWATGSNERGQQGDGTSTYRNVPAQVMNDVHAISAGAESSFFLKTDGSLMAAGSNFAGGLGDGTMINRSVPVQVPGFSDVQAMAAGYHSLILKNNGSVWAAGYNSHGQLGDGQMENPPADKSTPVFSLQLTPVRISLWQQEKFGAQAANPAVSGWDADPDRDGLPNLVERAFNLPPMEAGTEVLPPAGGMAGLPFVFLQQKPGGPVLSIRYPRLKNAAASGLSYTPQFSSAPELDNGWTTAAAGIETVESANDTWELVTVEDSDSPSPASRFVRVKVTITP